MTTHIKQFSVMIRLLLLSVLFVGLAPSRAQEQKPGTPEEQKPGDIDVISVSTNLVTVPVSVMDRQGRFIPGLVEGQFHIYEDGVEQSIAYFENAEKPFTVAFMLDASDSTRFKLKDIQDAAIEFVEQLRPDDRVIVAAFDQDFFLMAQATSDRQILTRAIRRVRTGGTTAVYNAIDVIINQHLNRVRGRKAIVLFSDGVDTASKRATYESTLNAAQVLDALVYPIQFNTLDDLKKQSNGGSVQVVTAKGESVAVAYARGERYLRALADKTGGRFYYTGTLKSLREVFTNIAQELRQQYSVSYYPKSDGQKIERRLKVTVDVPRAVIKTRRGYLYKGPTSRLTKANLPG